MSSEITALLRAWSDGDPDAGERLMPVVYDELRRRAAAQVRRERHPHALQPTELVHEAYLRLVEQDQATWHNRAQFFAVASQMMRRILVDRARARKMGKRSGRWNRVTLVEDAAKTEPLAVDLLDLDAALEELAAFDARKARVAELRFFGGLSLDEVGAVLDISQPTAVRDWRAGRAWLMRRLRRGPGGPPAEV
jgi:RNA polymerase sigma factor (TIGR02999 family)